MTYALQVLPAPNIKTDTFMRLKDIAFKIAKKLQITGPFNMQVLVYEAFSYSCMGPSATSV
jgi:hypothetical protein